MAVTDPAMRLADASLHIVGKVPANLSDRERADLVMLTAWACHLVARYLGDSPAPEAICKAAALRLAYYDWHARLSRRPADGGQLDQPVKRDLSLNPLRASGAMALLSPWLRRRAS